MYLSKDLINNFSDFAKKWFASGIKSNLTSIPFWELNLLFNSFILSTGTSSSFLPHNIKPDAGHGERKEKSYTFGWGDIEINLFISGLLIKSCIAISDPKENPAIQHWELSKFSLSNQSRAAAASASSPCPLSNSPSLFPTPLKFTRHTEKSFSKNV